MIPPSFRTLGALLTPIVAACFLQQASAHCLLLHDISKPGQWLWSFDPEVHFAELKSSDLYLSGDEFWFAKHDIDGELYGASTSFSPPVLGNMISIFVAYREGDLNGDFSTEGISPFPEGPYPGDVSFDREEFELAVDVKILNAVYARIAYNRHEMDGDWKYPGGEVEPQEYKYEAFEAGVGFRQDFVSLFNRCLTFGVDAYVAMQFYEYTHTEIIDGGKLESDGNGFRGDLELNAKYRIPAAHTRLVAAVGYTYQDIDDQDLGLTRDGFFVRLGAEFKF